MAVGAIPPPLFFERRRSGILLRSKAFSERRPDNLSRRSGRLERPLAAYRKLRRGIAAEGF
jgi:hypothetical protein